MKRIMMLFLVLAVFCQCAFARYPKPKGFVNDFAGILPADVEQRLEQKLRDYEKLTTVELVVVTTNSLDRRPIEDWSIDLANEWGVGKKKYDNGLVFVVAPKQREFRFEVGSGLEGDLPDVVCRRIRDEYTIPNFKKKNLAKGIEQTVDALIQKLGNIGAEERLIRRARQLEEARRQREREARAMLYVFLFVVAVVLLLVIVWLVRRFFRWLSRKWKEHLRREELRGRIRGKLPFLQEELDRVTSRINACAANITGFPAWAMEIARNRVDDAKSRALRADLSLISDNIKRQPDAALLEFASAKQELDEAKALLDEVEQTIPAQIAHYEQQASAEVKEAQDDIANARARLSSAKKRGYRIANDQEKQLSVQESSLKSLEGGLRAASPEFRAIFDGANAVSEKVDGIVGQLNKALRTKQAVDTAVGTLPATIQELEADIPSQTALLEQFKAKAHEDNWSDIEIDFGKLDGLFSSARAFVDAAKGKNSMDKQEFEQASNDIASANREIGQVRQILATFAERMADVRMARQSYSSTARDVERQVSSALSKVQDTDVGRQARKNAQSASSNLKQAKKLAGLLVVNWIVVAALLANANALANNAQQMAEVDIKRAEKKRKDSSRSSDYQYSTTPKFGGGGGGGFGGFGGGGFSGGGCSGSW